MSAGEVGVVVGRFQINELHAGHLALLEYVAERHERMLILVGIRLAESSEVHPLAFEARHHMLSTAFPKALVLPMVDRRSDTEWSTAVDMTIQSVYGAGCTARFHVGRDSFKSHYDGRYPVDEHDFLMVDASSTAVRNDIQAHALVTAEGRAGAIHAIMNLPHRHTLMVDMFVVSPHKSGVYHVLVGRKQGEREYRLPGGRVERGESFAEAASRELREETGIVLAAGQASWRIVGDFDVRDWRVQDTEKVTYKTVLMVAEHSWGTPTPGDDLVDVAWIHPKSPNVVPEHQPLVDAAVGFIERSLPHITKQGADRV